MYHDPHEHCFLRYIIVEFVLYVDHAACRPVQHIRTDVEEEIQVGERPFHKQYVPIYSLFLKSRKTINWYILQR